ncbi:GvpL/GvpF family gas vesicle protein [bacterium]|nr:GvpL/GvpF family gas vesicle protein [bacterium]
MATSTGYYLYGFIDCNQPLEITTKAVGGNDSVHNLPYHGIGVLYSAVNGKTIQPKRDNLMAHQKLLESLMEQYTVLPMRFGIVAQTKGVLYDGLNKSSSIIRSKLQYFQGKRELNIKAFWVKKYIYEHIINSYPNIRSFRDSIQKLKGQSGHYKSIELGQMVERALIAESEKEAEAITTEISSVALQQTKGKIFGELMFLNLAVLVNDQRESQLDQLVNEAAEKRKGKVQFKYIGPAPPASFVDIHLKF